MINLVTTPFGEQACTLTKKERKKNHKPGLLTIAVDGKPGLYLYQVHLDAEYISMRRITPSLGHQHNVGFGETPICTCDEWQERGKCRHSVAAAALAANGEI